MNSRPPPCEGDALPAELLPHMDATTRRSEVCMPFTCRGQVFFASSRPSARREELNAATGKAGPLRSWLRKGNGMCLRHTLKWAWARYVHAVDRSLFSNAFPPWYADRRAPAFPDACGKARPLRIRLAYQRPDRQDTGASPGRVVRLAIFRPRWTKPLASSVPLLPSIP